MNMRHLIIVTAALALGCGSAQHSVVPRQEALADGTFPPPHSRQERPDKQGKCYLPQGWPPEARVIARNGGCWTELDATEAQCREAALENPYHVWAEGRCWYLLPGGENKRQPTSSSDEPLAGDDSMRPRCQATAVLRACGR